MSHVKRIPLLAIGALLLALPAAGQPPGTAAGAIAVYGRKHSTLPALRRHDGAAWQAAQDIPGLGAAPRRVTLRRSPSGRECLALFVDEDGGVSATAHDGASWSAVTVLAEDSGANGSEVAALAYEQHSGRALCVYRTGNNANPSYRTWSDGAWSAARTLAAPSTGVPLVLALTAKPGADEIALLVLDSRAGLTAWIWDGGAFASRILLTGSAALPKGNPGDALFGAAYTGAGTLIAAWFETKAQAPSYRIWTGSTWEPQASASSVGATGTTLRLAADPAGAGAMLMTLDDKKNTSLQAWNGAAWSAATRVATNATGFARRNFDVAFEPAGGRALAMWSQPGKNSLVYRAWNGAAWSGTLAVAGAPGGIPDVVALAPDAEGQGMWACFRNGDDLYVCRWSGTDLGTPERLTHALSAAKGDETFMLIPFAPQSFVFTDVSAAMGFDVHTTHSADAPSGLHWGDLDNYGFLDALITGSAGARILRNPGGGAAFTMETLTAEPSPGQAALCDLDNDGGLDLWLPCGTCYRNDGTGRFTRAGDLGFHQPASTLSAAAADVRADGRADILMFSANGNWLGIRAVDPEPLILNGTADPSLGLNAPGAYGAGGCVAAADVNGDTTMDFFYAWNGGLLFLSRADGTYEALAGALPTDTARGPVGAAWGDYDNDGDLDLYVPGLETGFTGTLWRNDGAVFTDVTAAAGITDTSGQRSCCWGDYDNDGFLDLYVVTHSGAANLLYRNQGDGTFRSVAAGAEAHGDGHDAVFVDYDNDGNLDLAITQQGAPAVLLRNHTDSDRSLSVRLVGAGDGWTDRAAVGVRVELYDAAGTRLLARRDAGTARGFGTEPFRLHFGGVDPAAAYTLKAYFRTRPASNPVSVSVVPGAASTRIGTTTIPRMVTITEPSFRLSGWRERRNPDDTPAR